MKKERYLRKIECSIRIGANKFKRIDNIVIYGLLENNGRDEQQQTKEWI